MSTPASNGPEEQPITRSRAELLGAQVYALVRACPSGRVTTYGWIAAAMGFPRGARMVGWFMNHAPRWESVPAQRVINSKGELSGSWAFGQKGRMRAMLEQEGVVFDEKERVDLKKYGWEPLHDLSDDERTAILDAAQKTPADVDDDLLRLLMDDPASPFRIQPTGR